MHLNDLPKLVKQGTLEENILDLIFNKVGVSDGISVGTS
jgi:dihydroxy-acid dehydratase